MKVLLDTHALLWWLSDSNRLGENAREIIADPAHDILVSIGECPEVCVSGLAHGFSDTQAAKRSPNIMANWLRAANHSRTFRPSFSKLRIAR